MKETNTEDKTSGLEQASMPQTFTQENGLKCYKTTVAGKQQVTISFRGREFYKSEAAFTPYGYLCTCVKADNTLVSEDLFVFWDNLKSPNGEIECDDSVLYDATFMVDLDKMPGDTEKIYFGVTDDYIPETILDFIFRIKNQHIDSKMEISSKRYPKDDCITEDGSNLPVYIIAKIMRSKEGWIFVADNVIKCL